MMPDKIQQLQIRRQPLHTAQFIPAQPPSRLMLLKCQTAALNPAPVAVHNQMKSRVVPFNSPNKPLNHNARLQLLPNLPLQRLLRRLPRLHLAPGELPEILEITIPALGGENAPIGIVYYCGYNLNLFHIPGKSSKKLYNWGQAPIARKGVVSQCVVFVGRCPHANTHCLGTLNPIGLHAVCLTRSLCNSASAELMASS